MAQDLGFDAVTRNSMDVSGDRDFALDFLYAASVTMIHLSRLAEDWILYSSEEFGWMELGDGVTSGSSLMPQKKNPDSLELIRGKSGRVMGCLTSLMVTMKGLPMTYNRDMQEDKEPLFEAADQVAARSKWRAAAIESVKLNAGQARGGRGRELGGGDGPGGSAGARRHAVPPGAPDCRTVRAGKRAQRQEAGRLDARNRWPQFAPEFTRRLGGAARSAQGNAIARNRRAARGRRAWPRRWQRRKSGWLAE